MASSSRGGPASRLWSSSKGKTKAEADLTEIEAKAEAKAKAQAEAELMKRLKAAGFIDVDITELIKALDWGADYKEF